MFSFTIEPQRKVIRSTIEGFLTVEEVAEWSRREQEAVVALGCGSREFLLFVDTSRCAIQSQDVVARFQQLIVGSTYKARRIAIMQGNSLTKMQTKRIVAGADYIAHFDEIADAEAWLFAESDQAPASVPRIAYRA